MTSAPNPPQETLLVASPVPPRPPRRWRRSGAPSTRQRLMVRRAIVGLLCAGAFGGALFGFHSVISSRPNPELAQASLKLSQQYLAEGNASAARSQAFTAIKANPDLGEAHLALARATLALDEGVAAEAALRRAHEHGIDPATTHALFAHAILLQGDPRRAIIESRKAQESDRIYALRVQARAYTAGGNFAAAQEAAQKAVTLDPNSHAAWTDLGRFRQQIGDLTGAAEASVRAVELGRGQSDALLLRAEMVRSQFGLTAAIPWFETALKRDPYRHETLIQYAATLGEVGQTNAMLALTRRAMEVRPLSPQALYLQAVLAARAQNFTLARNLLQRAGPSIAQLPGALLLGGSMDLEQGAYGPAIQKLRQLLAMQPMNLNARRLLASAYLRADASKNGIDVLRPMLGREDADSYALTLAARGFERIGERVQAAQYFDRAANAIAPYGPAPAFSADEPLATLTAAQSKSPGDNPQVLIPWLRGLIDNGRGGEALAYAQGVARRNPGAPAASALVGDVAMLLGRPAEAIAWYRASADIRFDAPAMLRLVEALNRAGQRDEASRTLALFLSQNPYNIPALRITSQWQLAAGDYDSAIDSLEAIRLRIGNRDVGVLADLAYAYAQVGETDRAARLGEAAYMIAPNYPNVVGATGWALSRAQDHEAGIELLEKSVTLAPRHPMLRWQLAQAYAAAGRKADAAAQARIAIITPGFTQQAAAERLIASAS